LRVQSASQTFGIQTLMRVVYFIIGIVGTALAGWGLTETLAGIETFWTGCLGSSAAAGGAVALLIAAKKGYRGHWPFVFGTACLVLAFIGVGSEIDDYLAHQSKDGTCCLVLIPLLSGIGVLLLLSGHKLHRCLVELEGLRGRGRAPGELDAESGTVTNGGPTPPLDNSGAAAPHHGRWQDDAIRLRTFALTALFGLAALNGFLGHVGQTLADNMRLRLQTYGATVPAITVMALGLPPLFYVVGVVALLAAVLGLWRAIADNKLIYAAFAFLVLDIATLLVSHFAFTYVAIRMR
jgi:hypothetical protein